MFQYSRMNDPYQPFIDDAHYFKHVGIPGVSASVCREKYTGVRATTQTRQQRIRNKNETSKMRQQRLQKQSSRNNKNRNKNKQQRAIPIIAENTPQFLDLSKDNDEPEIELRRSRRIRQNKSTLALEENVHWENLPYQQQKAQYIVCLFQCSVMQCDVMSCNVTYLDVM